MLIPLIYKNKNKNNNVCVCVGGGELTSIKFYTLGKIYNSTPRRIVNFPKKKKEKKSSNLKEKKRKKENLQLYTKKNTGNQQSVNHSTI